ncbi:hypothetical protein [Enterobacter sp. Bisph1]|uniref:RipA family octameric membrane protein n=1 Tax=Enterobacter sp. Bisph1 TaxID=1274399 RepID=UPI00057C0CF2|nr:hypothetical protein [Enterobacter sp. Bisph1]
MRLIINEKNNSSHDDHFQKNIEYFATILGNEVYKQSTPTERQLTLLNEAYKQALDTRKFEIELYWKRASFIWPVNGALLVLIGIFAKLFYDAPPDKRTEFLLAISVISLLGYLVSMISSGLSQSGKYWQENWEYHLDMLEPFFCGHLFKTHISRRPKPYSISELQDTINLIMLLLWILIFVVSISKISLTTWELLIIIVSAIVLIFYKLIHNPFRKKKWTINQKKI